jgi:serine phosphatase RsbU (regulator of sigma subunit)/CHASE1-domain containing sensor protein
VLQGRRTLTALVIVALLAATALATVLAYQAERDSARDADEARAQQAALAVRQNLTILDAGLRGSSTIVDSNGRVDPERFHEFARGILRETPFSRLSLAEPVSPADRQAFERALGGPITRITDSGDFIPLPEDWDESSMAVTMVYPDNAMRRESLGADLFSDAERAPTTRAAIRSGNPRLSSPLELQRPDELGAAVYDPVAQPGEDEVAGVLATRISGPDVVREVERQLETPETISISDGGEPVGGVVPAADEDATATTVRVLGRDWQVAVAGATATDLTPAIAYGASGLALTLVAAGILLLSSRRERDLVDRQSESERLAARESLQVRITEAIEREIEGDARLGSLARQLVPAVGDVCVVHEATEGGIVRRVGVAAPDERTMELIRAMPEPPATSPIRAAISSRQPVLYTRVSEDREARRARERGIPPRERPGESERSPADLLEADEVSSMIVPLVARNRVLGTLSITVLGSTGRPPLTREDLAFAMEVATHAAVALDNARLYEQQRDIAKVLQGALIPGELIEVPGAEVAARHRAGLAGTEVGGDFYDLFEVGGHWMAVVGDVCGKGPEAAALTALARHTVRATARLGPAGAVARVHEAIRSSGEHTYVTLCCAELRSTPGGIQAAVTTAGHPEPWIVNADGAVRRLEVTGPLVGALDAPSYGAQEVRLEPGALLFMCSDGLPEARRNGELFGDRRLGALLTGLASERPGAMLQRLEGEIVKFVGGNPRDDLAMFALRVD